MLLQQFVSPEGSISTRATKSGNFIGTYGNVELSGTGQTTTGVINNSTSGSIVVRNKNAAYHKTMGSVAELRCWGAFGEGGTKIGLVYSKDYQNSGSNVNNNENSRSDNFVASVACYTLEVRGLVDDSSFATKAN